MGHLLHLLQDIRRSSNLLGLLDPWKWRCYDPSRLWEPLTQWRCVTHPLTLCHLPSDAMSDPRRVEYSGLVLIKPAAATYTPTG